MKGVELMLSNIFLFFVGGVVGNLLLMTTKKFLSNQIKKTKKQKFRKMMLK